MVVDKKHNIQLLFFFLHFCYVLIRLLSTICSTIRDKRNICATYWYLQFHTPLVIMYNSN